MDHEYAPLVVTYSGRRINLLDPQPEQIELVDIAHALAHLARFNGHTRTFYSVADHSIRVAEQMPAPLRLVGLMHDATEAYLGDVVRPLKRILPGYIALEKSMWTAIALRFGLPLEMPAAVRFADRVLVATELRDLLVPDEHAGAAAPYARHLMLEDRIHPLTSQEAEDVFLHLFDRYAHERVAAAA
jgi:5'-deoxynucleotidase YfbR-like HD superfamily hydrolase